MFLYQFSKNSYRSVSSKFFIDIDVRRKWAEHKWVTRHFAILAKPVWCRCKIKWKICCETMSSKIIQLIVTPSVVSSFIWTSFRRNIFVLLLKIISQEKLVSYLRFKFFPVKSCIYKVFTLYNHMVKLHSSNVKYRLQNMMISIYYWKNKVCGKSIATTITLLQHTYYYCNTVTCKICRKLCDQLLYWLPDALYSKEFGRNKIIIELLLY